MVVNRPWVGRAVAFVGVCGAWLLALGGAAWAAEPTSAPCELYAPAHFGNWYEVAGTRELRAVLAEARHWGFDRYGDWFDTLDCVDPFSGESPSGAGETAAPQQYSLGNALWERKLAAFVAAQGVGLQTDLVITPNHVYRDQLRREWLATDNKRIIGQLICPSVPQARRTILENQRHLFESLAAAGVRLTAINLAPYDYGGCDCERCRPWIVTFASLACEIHDLARAAHPGVELHFIGWWWTPDEHRQFAEFMDARAPGRATAIALHIPYGKSEVSPVALPAGCRRDAFVHIGYPDEHQPRDLYGLTGPVAAPARLERTVRRLREQSVGGVVAYSEGIYDDVNKALLAGLWTGRQATADEVLRAYAQRYFAADAASAGGWSSWLSAWGRPFTVEAADAQQSLQQLPGERQDWRFRQWELKVDLFAAHSEIGPGPEWAPPRLAAAERFWAIREALHRGVYGLGPQRHIFADRFIGLPWYQSWAANRRPQSRPAAQIAPEG